MSRSLRAAANAGATPPRKAQKVDSAPGREPQPGMPSRSSSLALALLLAATAALAGCKRQHDEVPCTAVAARFLVIAQAETQAAKVDEALRQRVVIQLPALRDAVDGACFTGNWSLEMRRCMVAAADSAALVACQRLLTDEQRATLERATQPPR
jgi:hypothetical protein